MEATAGAAASMVSIGRVGSKKKNGLNCGNSASARLDRPRVRAAPRMADSFQIEYSGPPRSAPGVAALAVALAQLAGALAGGPVATATRRAHQHAIAVLQHVLAAVVHLLAVDAHVAEPAGAAARQARRGEARALGHEAHHDRALRLALDQRVLAEAAPEAAAPARAGPHSLVVEEERAVALGHLHRCARDVAGPREDVLAVLRRGCAHPAVEEQHGGVRAAVVAHARLGHRPQR